MISSFIYSVVFSFLFYLVGFFHTSFWKFNRQQNRFNMMFLRMVLGIISITTIFAIVKTSGSSILIGIVVISLLFVYFNKDSFLKTPNFKILKTDFKVLYLYVLVLLIFNFLFFYIIYPNSFGVHPDYLFYGALSDYITAFGKESTYLSIYNPEQLSNKLYHFFNEWCVGFISLLINRTGSYSLLYVFHPITYSILFIGLIHLTQLITKTNISKSILLVSIFFIASSLSLGEGLPSLLNIGGFHLRYASFLSTPSSSKLVIVTILLLMMIVFYNKKKEYNAVIILSLICFIWPSTVPGIVGGVSLYILYKYFYKKEKVLYEIIIISITIFCFALLFLTQKNNIDVSPETQVSHLNQLQEYLANGLDIENFLKTLLETIGSRVYYYSILLVIIFLNFKTLKSFLLKKHQYKDLFILLAFVIITAFIARSLLFFITDSNQIFTNIFDNTLAKLVFFVVLLVSIKNKFTYIFVALFACLSIFTMYYQYSNIQSKALQNKELSTLEKEFSGKDNNFAVILKIENSAFSHISQVVYPPLFELRSLSPSYFPVNLTILDREYLYENDLKLKSRYTGLMQNSAFYMYLQDREFKNNDWPAKKQFLIDSKINYLIVENGSLEANQLNQLDIDKEIPSFNGSVKIYRLEKRL